MHLLRVLLLVFVLLCEVTDISHAAFSVRVPLVADTVVGVVHTERAQQERVLHKISHPAFRDRYRQRSYKNGHLGAVAYYLAIGGVCLVGALGLGVYIGLFVGTSAAILALLFALGYLVGVAGFVTGIVALAKGQQDRGMAVRAVILGAICLLGLVGIVISLFTIP